MVVGVLQFELLIEHAMSLKDKRRVVSGLKDRLHREHLVAVAEVDRLEAHRVAVLGLAVVSQSATHARSMPDRIIEQLRRGRDYVLSDHQVEIL